VKPRERTQTGCRVAGDGWRERERDCENRANEPSLGARPGHPRPKPARTNPAPGRTPTRAAPQNRANEPNLEASPGHRRPKTARTNPAMGALGKLGRHPGAGVQDRPSPRAKRRERTQGESGEIRQNVILIEITEIPTTLSRSWQRGIVATPDRATVAVSARRR
jgi:hypothetical protein